MPFGLTAALYFLVNMIVAGTGCKPLQSKKSMLEAMCVSRLKGNRAWDHLKLCLPWRAGVQATGLQQLWRTTAANTQCFFGNLPSLFVQTGHHSLLDTCTQQIMVTASSLYLQGQPGSGVAPAGLQHVVTLCLGLAALGLQPQL